MSEMITLELPEDLARRVRAVAAASHRRLEDAVVDWIGQMVADPAIELLADDELLRLCDAQLDEPQQSELSSLLARNREGELPASDRDRLDALIALYRQGLVRKARAWKEAITRGLKSGLADHAA